MSIPHPRPAAEDTDSTPPPAAATRPPGRRDGHAGEIRDRTARRYASIAEAYQQLGAGLPDRMTT